MSIQSRFKFTEPIFFDGVAWNYLKFDDFKNCIEAHIILNNNFNSDSYLSFFNIIDKNVIPTFEDDVLILTFDHGKCVVRLNVFEKKHWFSKKKYIRYHYKYIPRNLEHVGITKMKYEIRKVGNPKWDQIADFLNKSVN